MLRTGLARMGSRHLGGYNWDNAHLARCRSAGLATVAPPFAHRRPSRREGRNLLRPAGGPRSRAAAGARAADAQTSTIPALPQRARCPLSQYAPPRRLHANGEAFALPLDRAQQFCSARPVRAPTARKRFAQGKALPKTRRPRARIAKGPALCTCLSRTNGSQTLRTRQSASKDAPVTGADRERPSALHMPFPHQRLANASHKANRPANTFRPSKRPEKGARPALPPKNFFAHPLAPPGAIW